MDGLSDEEWVKVLIEEDMLNRCNYLSYTVNETLRIEPSLRLSTIHIFEEACEIGGKKILEG